jgi:hypothetical protein
MLTIYQVEVHGQPAARFQRSEKWMPVYKWLESLELDSLVAAKVVEAWLDSNPSLRDELLKEHTRQHLFRYVLKCHNNLLKKKKKQALKIAMVSIALFSSKRKINFVDVILSDCQLSA